MEEEEETVEEQEESSRVEDAAAEEEEMVRDMVLVFFCTFWTLSTNNEMNKSVFGRFVGL